MPLNLSNIPPQLLCLLIFFLKVIFSGYVVSYCMDGTMVYLMNPPMLTFGLLPRGFAIINRAEMSITRVVFADMLDRMCSDSQQECREESGHSHNCWDEWLLACAFSGTSWLFSGTDWLFPHMSCFAINLIQLYPGLRLGLLHCSMRCGHWSSNWALLRIVGAQGVWAQGVVGSRTGGQAVSPGKRGHQRHVLELPKSLSRGCFLWKEKENSIRHIAPKGWRENEPLPRASARTVTISWESFTGSTSSFASLLLPQLAFTYFFFFVCWLIIIY